MIKSNNLLKITFYIFLIFFLINYLFPGSLTGYFMFGDIGRHPSLADNSIYQLIPIRFTPFANYLNHFLFTLLISFAGFCTYFKKKILERLFCILLSFAVILELLHFVIPNRAFEVYDLVPNLGGVIFAYFIIAIYRFYNKNKI